MHTYCTVHNYKLLVTSSDRTDGPLFLTIERDDSREGKETLWIVVIASRKDWKQEETRSVQEQAVHKTLGRFCNRKMFYISPRQQKFFGLDCHDFCGIFPVVKPSSRGVDIIIHDNLLNDELFIIPQRKGKRGIC